MCHTYICDDSFPSFLIQFGLCRAYLSQPTFAWVRKKNLPDFPILSWFSFLFPLLTNFLYYTYLIFKQIFFIFFTFLVLSKGEGALCSSFPRAGCTANSDNYTCYFPYLSPSSKFSSSLKTRLRIYLQLICLLKGSLIMWSISIAHALIGIPWNQNLL